MKFAQVRYGTIENHEGEDSRTYTYLVEDTTRTGDNLMVSVRHAGDKSLFTTTGHLPPKENGGGITKQMPEIETKDGKPLTKDDLQEGFKAKELGVKKGWTGGIYKGLTTESPNKATMEARGRALEVAYKRLTDKGESPLVSKGEKTTMALEYVTSQEQGGKPYEPYENMMKRIGAK